jgi:diadenosine tetraphosphatase ApaH/serine/threonine PP2A family protein phosphatase
MLGEALKVCLPVDRWGVRLHPVYMRIAVLSDIHANLEALEAVMEDATSRGCAGLYCCGDVIGYAADPNACCERLRQYWDAAGIGCHPIVQGNHDHAIVHLKATPHFNPYASASADWTRECLTEPNREWLSALPYQLECGEVFLTHATARAPANWDYLMGKGETESDLAWFCENMEQRIYFCGHSHYPFFLSDLRGYMLMRSEVVKLEKDERCVVNVGSVGQPRDGDPRASYCVYDDEASALWLHRVAYDYKTAQDKIIKAGLPEILAARLSGGV